MFTTLAETYMTATRVETMLGLRGAEAERLAMIRARREAEREWIEARMREARAARRRGWLLGALRWTGTRLTAAGQALTRLATEAAPANTPECC